MQKPASETLFCFPAIIALCFVSFYIVFFLSSTGVAFDFCKVFTEDYTSCLVSLRSKRFRVVSEQRKNKQRHGTGFSVLAARRMERQPKNEREEVERKEGPLPALLLAPFYRVLFDSRSSFFAPKPHGNACYAGYLLVYS